LTDMEWERLKPLIPDASPGGRPRKTDMRAAMNAIFYLLRTGYPWRYPPAVPKGDRGGPPAHDRSDLHRFFAFPEAVQRIVYTTNAIEALNATLGTPDMCRRLSPS
jgi:transposase